jgi:hypothetical protein
MSFVARFPALFCQPSLMNQERLDRFKTVLETAASLAFTEGKELSMYLNPDLMLDYNPSDLANYSENARRIVAVSVQDYFDLCALDKKWDEAETGVLLRMAARGIISTLRTQLSPVGLKDRS